MDKGSSRAEQLYPCCRTRWLKADIGDTLLTAVMPFGCYVYVIYMYIHDLYPSPPRRAIITVTSDGVQAELGLGYKIFILIFILIRDIPMAAEDGYIPYCGYLTLKTRISISGMVEVRNTMLYHVIHGRWLWLWLCMSPQRGRGFHFRKRWRSGI